MFRLPKDSQQRAARSLQSNPAFNIILETLTEEYEVSVKGLLSANVENFGNAQGRSQLLRELIDALKFNY